jgi:coenzyme F420-reducing hydrogenase gamma subunit
MNKKLKIGIFSFTACEGCQIIMINSQELFGQISDRIELTHLPIIQEHNQEGPYDAVFVEGAITYRKQIKTLKQLRKKSKFLIAFGTCATFGGVSAIRGYDRGFKKKNTYKEFEFLGNLDVKGIGNYVKVDYDLRGCPPVKEEFIKVISALSEGKLPEVYDKSVCIECRAKKNTCLLTAGQQCLGPVTCGGCNALCTSKGIVCYGCRGPVVKANIDGLVNLFEKRGISERQICEMFMTFAGTSKRYEDFVRKVWQKR